MDPSRYLTLFGNAGRALSDLDWIERANQCLPDNLAALNARYLNGSRTERWLRTAYEPGPAARNFSQLSGGAMAEMLDQTATHCGSFVTGCPCPTLSLTVTIMRAGTAPTYTATGRVLKLTRASAVLAADLEDEAGDLVATATVVSQLITDLGRLA
jgi:uncharacterized protein (TIGR00369 family)